MAEIVGFWRRAFRAQRAVALVAPVLPGVVSLSATVSRPSLFVFNLLATQMLFVKQEKIRLMNQQVYPDEPEKSPNKLSLWWGNMHRQLRCKERFNCFCFFLVSALILLHLYTADLAQRCLSASC